ncbi:ATP-binding protein [bacterium]|nr:ATP-binding protein [bacterium]
MAKKQQIDPQALEQQEADRVYREGVLSLRDIIAPSSFTIENNYLIIGTRYVRTLFVYGYPRTLFTGWLSPIINLDEVIDISINIMPVESRVILENLKKKVGQLEASYQINAEKGKVRDPGLEAALSDAEELRDQLQVGEERFFRFGLYFTIYGKDLEELDLVQRKIESILGTSLIYTKPASVQMEQGFNSTLPIGTDQLGIYRNMNTGSLSTSFPFTTAELSRNEGILYGLNRHNNGLVLFDRFSLENANMVVFAKSGAGKSFTVKLECLRSLMMGTEIIIVDPENEYKTLCDAVGGSFVKLSLTSNTHINPFDLPKIVDPEEADNALRANIIMLEALIRVMFNGQLSDAEMGDLDTAIIQTYANKGITNDPLTHNVEPPVMNDLYNTLVQMGNYGSGTGPQIAARLRRFTEGSFSGIFSQQSNVNLDNRMVVFNIRDLEDELRPVGMFIALNYIWNRIKTDRKKRILAVDEAWQLMQYPDSAQFLFSIAKRCRKYYTGLTTITQDVEDFLQNRLGRAVVNNSSLQLLLKQNPAAVDIISQTFKLTSEESARLSQFPVGEGLFFAGLNHVIIRILASPMEEQLITTNPHDILEKRMKEQNDGVAAEGAQVINNYGEQSNQGGGQTPATPQIDPNPPQEQVSVPAEAPDLVPAQATEMQPDQEYAAPLFGEDEE